MRRLSMRLVLTLVFALSIVPSAALADDTMSPDVVKRFLVFWSKAADGVLADKGDCAKMATDLNALIAANAATIGARDAERKAGKKMPPAAVKQLMGDAGRMEPALQPCKTHADVQAALRKM